MPQTPNESADMTPFMALGAIKASRCSMNNSTEVHRHVTACVTPKRTLTLQV